MSTLQENLTALDSPEYQKKVKSSLLDLAQNIFNTAGNGRPIQHNQIISYLNTLQNFLPSQRTLSDDVREWVLSSDGDFLSSDVARELNLSSRVDKKNLSKILERLRKENIIAKCGEKRGCYRVIDTNMVPMDWENCDVTKTFDLDLPLGFHKLMYIYPKNILVVAGNTNAGKTAWLLNLVRENAHKQSIDYFSNDLTPEELKKRVQRFTEAGMSTENFSKCRFMERSKNYLDVINPDGVTIIDYLKLTDKFWLVARDIDEIYSRLKKGIAIIAIQKDTNSKMGRGGDFAAADARLYFTLEKGKINMIKMKNLIDPAKDPNGRYCKFNLWAGCKFVPQGGWQGGPKPDPEGGQGDDSAPPF